jgi:hypothetical protein
MPAIRKRRIPRRPTINIQRAVDEYCANRGMRERSEYWESRLKADLMAVLADVGQDQEGGHKVLDLDEPVRYVTVTKAGKQLQKWVTGIQRQRRVSQPLDEQRALAFLKQKGLLEACTSTVLVLNEDAILAANYSGDITDDELKGLYDEIETFAFYPVYGEGPEE